MKTPRSALSASRLGRREFIQAAAASGAALLGAARGALTVAEESRPPLELGLGPQLFLDDALIDSSSGLERVVHKPRKAGLIQESDGRPWELGDALSVARDLAGRFHMTYRFSWSDPSVRDLHPSIGEDRAHWFRETVGYATSDDGLRWTKPVLGLIEAPVGFRPAPEERWKDGVFTEPTDFSTRNNLGCPAHVLLDLGLFGGVADPARRYLVNTVRKSDTHPFAEVVDAGLYFAADLPRFDLPRFDQQRFDLQDGHARLTPVWEGPRRGPRGPSVRVAGYDAAEAVWFECTQAPFGDWRRRGGRDITRFTSPDLREWSPPALVLPIAPDEPKDPQDWVEYMDIRVFRAGGLWLGQLIVFHGDRSDPQGEMPTAAGVWRKGTTEMRLVSSRDGGKTWARVGGRDAWIPHHEEPSGFDRLVFTASPVRAGAELWLYYSCWDGDHLVWKKDGTTYYKDRTRTPRTARAVLRWDGFASLRPVAGAGGPGRGEAVTRLLAANAHRLAVNAAAEMGAVRVAVEDASGRTFHGYTLDDCAPLSGGGVSQEVRWRGGPELPAGAREKPFRLRFEVRGADVYGFELLAGSTSDTASAAGDARRAPRVLAHVPVYSVDGRFGGWPANHGAWSWGNEIVVGFSAGFTKDQGPRSHAIDHDLPEEHLLARSLDGGRTWAIENPGAKGMLVGTRGMRHGTLPAGVSEPPLADCRGGIDFTHPDFAFTARMSGNDTGESRFYVSYDRARTWDGPFRLPLFGQRGIAARTDAIVNGRSDCFLFLTASKSNNKEGRVICVRTRDGGRSWELVALIGAEPEGYEIMPSTVRLGPGRLLTTVRCRKGDASWIDAYESSDEGRSWRYLNRPVRDTGEGNPPALIRLRDGRLCLTYGVRAAPFSIEARLSRDEGRTWSEPIVLRADGAGRDIGYPRTVERPDGNIVTVYYFTAAGDLDRTIQATIWDPGEGAP